MSQKRNTSGLSVIRRYTENKIWENAYWPSLSLDNAPSYLLVTEKARVYVPRAAQVGLKIAGHKSTPVMILCPCHNKCLIVRTLVASRRLSFVSFVSSKRLLFDWSSKGHGRLTRKLLHTRRRRKRITERKSHKSSPQ